MKIEIYSDIACPWCYIGKKRLEAALESFEGREQVEIEWKSFELDPQMPSVVPLTSTQYLVSKKGIPADQVRQMIENCTQVAASAGIKMSFDTLKLFNTRLAHQLLHYAKSLGCQADMKERLFHAAFVDGRELGKIEVLIEIAAEAGFDALATQEALSSNRYLQQVLDDEKKAEAVGVHGVPYVVINDSLTISGAQTVAVFKRALQGA
jgi:predicted DsbA family dithiol-disulfide isomerase